ncbi:hypothetical protein EYF80_057763 [Liparis tanakae]|uniref:Uncharacterized protein n=1 Tax=Liparis tanakae TaxID=230148 RepID=A0A4Z2ETG8_9TELE|nr:hypothetical protein EYF80_057763 [Liparis tanakae]
MEQVLARIQGGTLMAAEWRDLPYNRQTQVASHWDAHRRMLEENRREYGPAHDIQPYTERESKNELGVSGSGSSAPNPKAQPPQQKSNRRNNQNQQSYQPQALRVQPKARAEPTSEPSGQPSTPKSIPPGTPEHQSGPQSDCTTLSRPAPETTSRQCHLSGHEQRGEGMPEEAADGLRPATPEKDPRPILDLLHQYTWENGDRVRVTRRRVHPEAGNLKTKCEGQDQVQSQSAIKIGLCDGLSLLRGGNDLHPSDSEKLGFRKRTRKGQDWGMYTSTPDLTPNLSPL